MEITHREPHRPINPILETGQEDFALTWRLPLWRLPPWRLPLWRLPLWRLPLWRLPLWRLPLVFNLSLLALIILGTRLATLLHELLGHALTAVVAGGHVEGIRVSLFGGGRVYYQLGAETGSTAHFFVTCGGLMTNLATGLLVFLLLKKFAERPGLTLFMILFGMVSFMGALAYAALGFYYLEGDPGAWIGHNSTHGPWLSVPFLMISPLAAYIGVKSYADWIETFFPLPTMFARLILFLATLGVTGMLYMGLYKWTAQTSVALDSPIRAHMRAEQNIRKEKAEAIYRRYKSARPELTEEEIRVLVEQTPIVVRPEEIPKKFPLKPVIALLFVLGGIGALWRVEPRGGVMRMPLSKKTVVFVVGLALSVLVFLTLTGGWIYRS
jgi:hypothetical protein